MQRTLFSWRGLLITLAVGLVGGGAALTYAQFSRGKGDSPGNQSKSAPAAVLTKIENLGDASPAHPRVLAGLSKVPVEAVQRPMTLRLTGTLTPDEDSDVSANVAGVIQETFVDRGSVVKKGDILVQLDPTDAKNALAEGEAMVEELRAQLGMEGADAKFDVHALPEVNAAKLAMDLATANYRRAVDLHEKKVITHEVFDQTQTEFLSAQQRHQQAIRQGRRIYQSYLTAQARARTLRKAVEDTSIRAPFDGWVSTRWVSPGERVVAIFSDGAKVATLLKMDPLRLTLTVPQQHVGEIRPGEEVVFEADAYPGKQFRATVKYVSPTVTRDTRSLTVEALVPNADGVLKAGLFVSAQLQLPRQQAELFVPRSAVREQGETASVVVVRDGIAREQIVALGEPRGNRVQVLSGLSAKDIVLGRAENVRDGDRIQ